MVHSSLFQACQRVIIDVVLLVHGLMIRACVFRVCTAGLIRVAMVMERGGLVALREHELELLTAMCR